MSIDPKVETVDFYGELQSETAACWFIYDGIHTVAIPKSLSQIRMINTVDARITVPLWLAKKKGII